MMGVLTKKRQDANLGLRDAGLVWFGCFVSNAPTGNSDSSPGLIYKLCIWNGHMCGLQPDNQASLVTGEEDEAELLASASARSSV